LSRTLALNYSVPGSQTLLFPDSRPLVERLGRNFFRQLTERPGVYLMQDAAGLVIYVGKAKNLRQRLGHYRVANPDRLGRRHLRLLRQVVRIELHECADETEALAKEAELLRALKPKFNRAGVWPATPRFLVWRGTGRTLELAISETPGIGWQVFGPFGSGLIFLRAALARLFWYALNPASGSTTMPQGWLYGRLGTIATISDEQTLQSSPGEMELVLAKLFQGDADGFVAWVGERTKSLVHAYDLAIRDADLETLSGFMEAKARRPLPFAAPVQSADVQRINLDLLLPFMDEDWKHP
jgi:predicted GIY-YIG superfamily endonuclease